MNSQNNNDENNKQGTEINISNYLVTQKVDTSNIDDEKLNSDLSLLSKGEQGNRYRYKTDIAKDITDQQIKRAVSSLKLSNPFRGY
jgi:hypothetical protein